MKNRQRATLYASLFLLTTVTFGNSSAMEKKYEESPEHLKQKNVKQKNDCEKYTKPKATLRATLQASIKDNPRFWCATGVSLIGAGTALVCPCPHSALGILTGYLGVAGQIFYLRRLSRRLSTSIKNLEEFIENVKNKED